MISFEEALLNAGYEPPFPLYEGGKIYRFGPKKAHWLIYDGSFGAAGDWRGINPKVRWREDDGTNLLPDEKHHVRKTVRNALREYRNDKEQRRLDTAEYVESLWPKFKLEGRSPYLERKQIQTFGARFATDKWGKNYLAVPMRDANNKLWSIQRIYNDGTKLFWPGGRKEDNFHLIGDMANSEIIYFCEGFATAASVHMATQKATVVCFDAGNLGRVIDSLRPLHPNKDFIIAADDDAFKPQNAGIAEAQKAAAKHSIRFVIPHFTDRSTKPTDFNDLHVLEGLDKVREQLIATVALPVAQIKDPNSWPDPDMSLIDADQAMPPPFDPHCLPPVWSEWVVEQAEALGCPVDYVAASLLASASTWLGNARRAAATHDWIEPPHIWFALIGAPSTGKSPAQRPFIDVCKLLEHDERPAWEEKCSTYNVAVETANAKLDKWKNEIKTAVKNDVPPPDRPDGIQLPDNPILPRVMVNDATIEEATNILAGNPKGLLLIRDELSGWIGSFDRYGGDGSDRAFYLECWNGSRHTVDRVKKSGCPIEVPYASLSILGGLQPDKLRQALSGADDGLAARFIYIWPSPPPFQPLGANSQARSERRQQQLLNAAARLRKLRMSQAQDNEPKAQIIPLQHTHLFDEMRKNAMIKSRATQGLAAGWHGKTPARILRLALVIEFLIWATSDHRLEPDHITDTSITYAGRYLTYAEKMFDRAISGLGITQQEADAAFIARHIIKSQADSLNERELYQTPGLSHLRQSSRRKEALAVLERLAWIKPAAKEAKGRPRGDWLVNPQLFA